LSKRLNTIAVAIANFSISIAGGSVVGADAISNNFCNSTGRLVGVSLDEELSINFSGVPVRLARSSLGVNNFFFGVSFSFIVSCGIFCLFGITVAAGVDSVVTDVVTGVIGVLTVFVNTEFDGSKG